MMRLAYRVGLAVFLGALWAISAAQGKSPQTALEWYDHIQRLREEASPYFRPDASTPEELKIAARKHREMLAILHDPKLAKFRKENVYLRVKDQDLYADLILIHAKLGDAEGARQAARELLTFGRDPQNAEGANPGYSVMYLRNFEPVRSLLASDAVLQGLVEEIRRLDPTWDLMYARLPYSLTYRPELPLEERIAGLTNLWSEVKYNFAFFDNTDVDWNAKLGETLPQAMAATTTFDYYQVLRRMIASLGDGHTNVYFPPEIRKERYGGRPPIRTEAIDGKVYVRRISSPSVERLGLEVGDEIRQVDGEDVRTFAERSIAPFESASTPQDKQVRLYDYFLLVGPPEKPVTLQVRKRDGSERSVTLNRSEYPDVRPRPTYEFRVENGVAIVRFDDFSDAGPIRQFMRDFEAHPKLKAIVFDVRENGGGNSDYAEAILGGLIDRPVRMAPSETRVYRPTSRAGRNVLKLEKLEDWTVSPSKRWKFTGPVALLVGPRTFSAAEDFVSMFVGAKRGPIIGETTAGSTGQPLSIPLPAGGSARICVKRDYLPDGTRFVGKGIQPTIRVRHTPDDLRRGHDPVLQRAIEEVAGANPGVS